MKKVQIALSHVIKLAAILIVVMPASAHAYLDPGTGSSVVQIIIAGIATSSYVIKVYWKQIRAFFMGIFSSKEKS